MAMMNVVALSEHISALYLENGGDLDKILNSELVVETLASSRMSALSLACQICNIKLIMALLRQGADVNMRGDDEMSPLHIICNSERHQHVHTHIAELLLQYNVDVNQQDVRGRTALLLACSNSQVSLVELLIRAGCDVNISDNNGDTPFTVACRMASAGWYFWNADKLNDSENDEDHLQDDNFPPVIICKSLLQAGANPKQATLLPSAVLFGTVDIVKEFLDLGMDVNLVVENQGSPLRCACSSPHIPPGMVKLLLENGADVNEDSGGYQSKPIILAYVHSSLDKMRLLLSYGATLSCEEISELVSVILVKLFLESPLVVSEESQELLPWMLLLKAGFRPRFSQLVAQLIRASLYGSYDQIRPWIRKLFSPVLSLADMCRVTIRSQLQPSIDDRVDSLPLPNTLKGYLKFDEFSTLLCERQNAD